jgi:hypothetical protein
MGESCNNESGSAVDSLRVQLTNGEGKLVYDSNKDKPDIGYPTKPLKFCGQCGGELQPIIYMCKCCGERYVQSEDRKTGRIMLATLPKEPTINDPAQKTPST